MARSTSETGMTTASSFRSSTGGDTGVVLVVTSVVLICFLLGMRGLTPENILLLGRARTSETPWSLHGPLLGPAAVGGAGGSAGRPAHAAAVLDAVGRARSNRRRRKVVAT